MASLEQLQMLGDDESSTTSSSSSSSSSTSINGTDDVANSLTASNDDEMSMAESNGAGASTPDATFSSAQVTGGAPEGHSKKRIKLSFGGTLKAIVSSAEGERENLGSPRVEESTRDTTKASGDDETPVVSATEKPATSTTGNGSNLSPGGGQAQSKPSTEASESSETNNNSGAGEGTKPPPSRNGSAIKSEAGKQASKPHPTSTAKQKTTNSKQKTATQTAAGKSNGKETASRPQAPKKQSSSSSSFAGASSASATKKRSSIRSIRIMPMSSPGLLLPPGNNSRGNANNPTKMLSPNDVFSQTMATAGYTTEARTETPHRGSSVQRVVDDMFDSDVKFCLNFPKLVPEDWFQKPSMPPKVAPNKTAVSDVTVKIEANSDAAAPPLSSSGDGPATTLPETAETVQKPNETDYAAGARAKLKTIVELSERLIKAFKPDVPSEITSRNQTTGAGNMNGGRKRCRTIPQYSDIVPLSLTLPYPNEYFQRRSEYIEKVNERERAIVRHQEQQESLDADPEGKTQTITVPVPPIPPSPQIPEPKELQGIVHVEELFGSQDQQKQNHPLYLPGKHQLVDHLDKRCFHVMIGRYFGLRSNTIADPYFVGPSAPGIGGLTLSATTGLATASTGGGAGSLGGPLLMTPSQQSSATPSSASVVAANMSKSASNASSSSSSSSPKNPSATKATDKSAKAKKSPAPSSSLPAAPTKKIKLESST